MGVVEIRQELIERIEMLLDITDELARVIHSHEKRITALEKEE